MRPEDAPRTALAVGDQCLYGCETVRVEQFYHRGDLARVRFADGAQVTIWTNRLASIPVETTTGDPTSAEGGSPQVVTSI
jgi:hypothetical protein